MAQGSTARKPVGQQVAYLKKDITFADDGIELTVGTIPANSLILKPLSGMDTQVAFNAGTSAVVDIGDDSDPNLYGTALDVSGIGFDALDEAVSLKVSEDTTITATLTLTGTAATAGQGTVVIAYITDQEGS